MPIDLSEDTEIETTTVASEDTQSEFEEMVRGVEESTKEQADEPVEEEAKEEAKEETPEPTPEPTPTPVVEGPTAAGKMAAEQAGIPAMIIEAARDDEALHGLIRHLQVNQPEGEPSPTKLELPDDEYPEDDPVRKAFATLQSQLADVQSQLKATASKTTQFEEQQQKAAEATARQTQEEFDKTLNDFGIDAFGNTKNLSNANFRAREATYNLVQDLRDENPTLSVAELAKKAAEMLYPTNNFTPDAKAAIRKQSNSRLGKGPSQPAEPSQRNGEAMMDDFLKAAGLKD